MAHPTSWIKQTTQATGWTTNNGGRPVITGTPLGILLCITYEETLIKQDTSWTKQASNPTSWSQGA